MSEVPTDQLDGIMQQASVTTATAARVTIGGVIPSGHVRKVVRVHVPGAPGAAVGATVTQGSTNTPAAVPIDTISVASDNDDYTDRSENPRAPIWVIRPDETGTDVDDRTNTLGFARIGATNVTMSITFFDERN